MQFAVKAQPNKSVSRDQSRPALTRVVLNVPAKPKGGKKAPPWEGALTATDSYQAVKIPVTFDEDDEPIAGVYYIDSHVFKDNRGIPLKLKRGAKGSTEQRLVTPTQEIVLEKANGAFNFDGLVPEKETSFEIGLNIDVLKAATEGLGSKQIAIRFTLDGAGDPSALRPILVRPLNEDGDDGRIALVMPVRIAR